MKQETRTTASKLPRKKPSVKPAVMESVESLQEILLRERLTPRIFIGAKGVNISRFNSCKSK